jgi:hypothetical protein
MTKAQMKEKINQDVANSNYESRKFRKKCVAQGIVQFVREYSCYEMIYRGHFICYISGRSEEKLKLLAVWNTIKIAENNR